MQGKRLDRWILLATWLAVAAAAEPLPVRGLQDGDRVLVLAPHPDDEVLGCGGVIQAARARNCAVRVVFLTHGDENQWSFLLYRKHPVILARSVRSLGQIRAEEARAATAQLGVVPADVTFLGYPDFGTLTIWNEHWGSRPAYKSLLTRATAVPYPEALRPGAAHRGEEILRDLTRVIEEFHPTKLFVSHPADHNGDHQALYLFSQVALWGLENKIRPAIYPYLVHYRRWPQPHQFDPAAALEPPAVLHNEAAWGVFPLTPAQVDRKYAALKQHATQYRSNGRYLRQFIRANELFGDWPAVDVTSSPNPMNRANLLPHKGPSQQHTDAERTEFTAVDWDQARRVGNDLELSLRLSRPLAREVQASVHIVGYRANQSFVQMPKIHVKLGELGTTISDQDRPLPEHTWQVRRSANAITIRLPLATLGQPDRTLVGARTYLLDVPLDWMAWRVLYIR